MSRCGVGVPGLGSQVSVASARHDNSAASKAGSWRYMNSAIELIRWPVTQPVSWH